MGAIAVKNSVLSKLSAEQQRIVEESFSRHTMGLLGMVRKQNQEAIKVMVDYGIKILKVPDDQVEQFKELSARALQKMRGLSFSPGTLKEVRAQLEAYRRTRKQ